MKIKRIIKKVNERSEGKPEKVKYVTAECQKGINSRRSSTGKMIKRPVRTVGYG